MTKVRTTSGYDFYKGEEKGKPFYNIVPKGAPKPTTGYYSAEYIAKIKGVPVKYFF